MARDDHNFNAVLLAEDIPAEIVTELPALLEQEVVGVTASDGNYYEVSIESVVKVVE